MSKRKDPYPMFTDHALRSLVGTHRPIYVRDVDGVRWVTDSYWMVRADGCSPEVSRLEVGTYNTERVSKPFAPLSDRGPDPEGFRKLLTPPEDVEEVSDYHGELHQPVYVKQGDSWVQVFASDSWGAPSGPCFGLDVNYLGFVKSVLTEPVLTRMTIAPRTRPRKGYLPPAPKQVFFTNTESGLIEALLMPIKLGNR